MKFELNRDSSSHFSCEDNSCAAHFHHSAELLYVLKGEKDVYINGEHYLLKQNDLLLCPPHYVHSYIARQNAIQICVTIPPEFCLQFNELCAKKQPKSIIVHDAKEYLPFITQFKNVNNKILFTGLANCVLGLFVRDIEFITAQKQSDRSLAEQIAEHIDVNFAEQITLKSLAHKFGYSPCHFSYLFHKIFYSSVPQYVNEIRVRKSLQLLKKQSVVEAGLSCGFLSPQQYFLNFKKVFGCSPKQYLKNYY